MWYKCKYIRDFAYAINNTHLAEKNVTCMYRNMHYNIPLKYHHISFAIANNCTLNCIQWIYKYNKSQCDTAVMLVTAIDGRLDIIDWLYANKCVYCLWCEQSTHLLCTHIINHFTQTAAEFGHINILKWVHENNRGCIPPNTINYALEAGQLHVAKYLLYNCLDENWCGKSLELCAEKGMYEIVQWIHAKCNYNDENVSTAIIKAAANGHLNIVIWLCENRATLYTKAKSIAYINGHVQIVNYLRGISKPTSKNDNTTLLHANFSNA